MSEIGATDLVIMLGKKRQAEPFIAHGHVEGRVIYEDVEISLKHMDCQDLLDRDYMNTLLTYFGRELMHRIREKVKT